MPSANACAGIYIATRTKAETEKPRTFRDRERLWEAFARDEVTLDEAVRCERVMTSVGRHLVWGCVEAVFGDESNAVASDGFDAPWYARRIERLLDRAARRVHVEAAARCAEALDRLGSFVFARSGYSLAMDDFAPAPGRAERIAGAFDRVRAVEEQFAKGEITYGERYNRVVDRWRETVFEDRDAVRRAIVADDPLVVAGTATPDPDRRPTTDLASVRAMRGQTWHLEASERPILHNVGDGFDAFDAMHLWSALRRGELRSAETDETVASMLVDLDAVLGGVHIVARDCGTTRGMRIAIEDDGDISERVVFAAAIESRVLAEDVRHGGEVLATAGTLISGSLAKAIACANVPAVVIRDPVACASRGGVCTRCMGLDPDDFTWLQPSDAIGARAAQRIARESRKFGRGRVFHIC